MDDGLIRQIREAEEQAAYLVSAAKKTVEAELEGIEKGYAAQKENWKAEYPALLKKALSEAEMLAVESSGKKRMEAEDRILRMKDAAGQGHSRVRDFLLEKITGSGHEH